MFKRGFVLAACGALALLLTAAESSQAQVFFPDGRGAFFLAGRRLPRRPDLLPTTPTPITTTLRRPPTAASSSTA